MAKNKIVVFEDNEKTIKLLKSYLSQFDFEIIAYTNPVKGLQNLKRDLPDIIILDVMMPDMDGFEVCKEVRKEYSIPILMLTARGDVTDRIVGLELGADDYLPKPFEPRELLVRIQTILRRASDQKILKETIRCGRLEIVTDRQQVLLDGNQLELTTYEYDLLLLFVQRKGRVLSREQIISDLKGIDWSVFDRSIDTLISRLRQKLGDNSKNPEFIKTIWGSGYKFIGYEA
ncbi:MAG: response regulator transcription factor [Bacteroidota bacterium]